MYQKSKICFFIFTALVALDSDLYSQITSSPYSMFGLGSVEGNSTGINNAMGGTGIAFLSGHTLNLSNPASTGGIDSIFTIFEIGIEGKYTSFTTSRKSQSLFDANFRYIDMGFRLTRRWAVSAGITPYSTVGYNINVMSPIEGSSHLYNKTYRGEGGVNKFFIGNSYRLTRNLTIGINTVYLFGNLTHSESSADFNYTLEESTYLSNFNLNYGLNYQFSINQWKYNIGFIYDNGKTLLTDKTSKLTNGNEYTTIKSSSTEFRVPQSFGFGLAFGKDYFRGGIDYENRRWEDIEFANPLLKSRNSNRYSFGIEIPSLGIRRGGGKMIFYRFGAQYCESYMVIKGIPVNYRSVSLGTGIPVKGMLSILNLSLELGQNGTLQGGLFKESFCTFHVDISLKDIWFVKRKYM
jgi:hypothetical protein